ncbi:MAG: biopolymer transporter ExbD [Rhodanobacteraceae bacterium]|jgi:biopolymer transport protein ExbD|nr:biopolymer transporter ExbD [Rhodanobacteraceae bacterium]
MGMSTGGGGQQNANPMTDINTTPLVDVMLVLLIIFMITAPLMQNKVPISIPEAANEPDSTEERAVTLNIQDKGNGMVQYYWVDDPIGIDGLEARLALEAAKKPQPEIKIRGDRSVQYKHVRAALDLAKRKGISKIGFVTAPGE